MTDTVSESNTLLSANVAYFAGILKASAPVTTTMGVNGAFLKAIDANSVGLRGPSVITAPVAMRDTFVILGKTSIHGTLDGRDLRSFEADVVPKRGWVSIGGNCVFYAGLAVSGNIAADTVNDLMLSYDVLLKSSDQSIKGKLKPVLPYSSAPNF